MSDSVRPHRRQPTRLPHIWDSPGKNTGVGCHFLLQCMKVKSESEFAQSCPTLSDPMDCSLPGSSIHGIFQARVLEWGAVAFSTAWPQRGGNSVKQSHKGSGDRIEMEPSPGFSCDNGKSCHHSCSYRLFPLSPAVPISPFPSPAIQQMKPMNG